MNGLRFYALFNSISVISGQWAVDNERLCERNPVTIEKCLPRAELEFATSRPALTH